LRMKAGGPMTTPEEKARIAGILDFLTLNCAETLYEIQARGLVACWNEGELYGRPWDKSIGFCFSKETVEAKTHICIIGDWFGMFFKARFKISPLVKGGDA
jgi:hypothetical protein